MYLWVYDKCCVFTIKLPMARWVAGRPDRGKNLYLLSGAYDSDFDIKI